MASSAGYDSRETRPPSRKYTGIRVPNLAAAADAVRESGWA